MGGATDSFGDLVGDAYFLTGLNSSHAFGSFNLNGKYVLTGGFGPVTIAGLSIFAYGDIGRPYCEISINGGPVDFCSGDFGYVPSFPILVRYNLPFTIDMSASWNAFGGAGFEGGELQYDLSAVATSDGAQSLSVATPEPLSSLLTGGALSLVAIGAGIRKKAPAACSLCSRLRVNWDRNRTCA
jgi:hypothetical protein